MSDVGRDAVTVAAAPGKIILCGEHAVVYGRPAIAVPVTAVAARAEVRAGGAPGVRNVAPALGEPVDLTAAAADDPLATTVRLAQQRAGLDQLPDLTITVIADIPIASGLGSGAAVAAAMSRALLRHLGRPDLADDATISALTYEVERLHHGTPSGIDNTVVSYGRPVYFVRGEPRNRIETLRVGAPLYFLVGDTGRRSHTRDVVGDVRAGWTAAPEHFEALFDACGRIVRAARAAVERGDAAALGALMDENQAVLGEMTVSGPALDRLVAAARGAGALGAKLSGAGRGGNMIALVTPATATAVRAALLAAGATAVLATALTPAD